MNISINNILLKVRFPWLHFAIGSMGLASTVLVQQLASKEDQILTNNL